MTDREKAIKAVEYLNWYFTQDDGTADENAVKAWEVFSRKQKPRVMSLEEVRAAEVVWLEQCGTCVCAIKIQNFDNGTMSFAYEYNYHTLFINIDPEYYGKILRCWTARPTDEQMEAEPWETGTVNGEK